MINPGRVGRLVPDYFLRIKQLKAVLHFFFDSFYMFLRFLHFFYRKYYCMAIKDSAERSMDFSRGFPTSHNKLDI